MRGLFLALGLMLLAVPALALEGIGNVAAIRGEVVVVRAGATLEAVPGLALEEGDRVVTTANGRALLQLEGGLTVTVASGTELVLAEVGRPPQRSSFTAWLDLVEGLVRAVLTAPTADEDVEIRTPIAVTSVRSTEWTVEHAAGQTAVFVRDGEVAVRAAGGEVMLAEGEGTDVRPADPFVGDIRGFGGFFEGLSRAAPADDADVRDDAAPSDPVVWGAARVERTLARTSLTGP